MIPFPKPALRALAFGLCALAACAAPQTQSAPATPEAPLAHTSGGDVRGVYEDGFAVFKGIPFAAAPVGAWRWRPPQPAPGWQGVREAAAYGPMCWQPTRPDDEAPAPMSEDCLTLNVWTPRAEAGAGLPVMVWVHGGAFIVGSGRMPDGITELSRQNVVLVTLNYRVGRLGFFAHPAAAQQHPDEAVGNYWLMDQIAALQWVKDNIAQFGGDPGNVTIFGVSAGGSSVNSLTATPAARGLFHRAIVHSGGGLFNSSRPLARAQAEATAYGAQVGAPGADAAALEALRALAPEQILAAESGPPNFGAIEDGRLLPAPLSLLFARGEVSDVDYMVGSTSDEASIFGLMGFDEAVLEQRFGVRVGELRGAYPAGLSSEALLREIQTDFIFTSGAEGMAHFMAANGRRTYAFHFAYVREDQRASMNGVPHGGDIPYVFGLDSFRRGAAGEASARDRAMALLVQRYWANFARSGDPNGDGLPAWPAYGPGSVKTLVFADETAATENFRAGRLAGFYALWARQTGGRFPQW